MKSKSVAAEENATCSVWDTQSIDILRQYCPVPQSIHYMHEDMYN